MKKIDKILTKIVYDADFDPMVDKASEYVNCSSFIMIIKKFRKCKHLMKNTFTKTLTQTFHPLQGHRGK